MELADTPEFHYRRRYGLPSTDPRYLRATREDIILDYWAHAFHDNPKLREEHHNPDFEEELAALEAEIEAQQAAEAAGAGGEAEPAAADGGGDEWETEEHRWS